MITVETEFVLSFPSVHFMISVNSLKRIDVMTLRNLEINLFITHFSQDFLANINISVEYFLLNMVH